uniref:Uncharacterized protein n=1 Tax=Meloidogyne hapla TaxID=6305 RepID=A0A1I8BJV8_MELHA
MSTTNLQQFNNNSCIIKNDDENNLNEKLNIKKRNKKNLNKNIKSSFPSISSSKLQQHLLPYCQLILIIYFIFLTQIISCYSKTYNRHLRRAIEYQHNNEIFRYQCPNG